MNNENKNSKKKTVIDESIDELKSIMEKAEKSAKDKLAEQWNEKFEQVLAEEIKNNKELVKESKGGEKEEESDKEDKEKDTNDEKDSVNETENIDMRELSNNDVVEAFDEADDDDDFDVEFTLDDVAAELGELEGGEEKADEVVEPSIEETPEPTTEDVNNPYEKFKQLHEMMTEMIQEMEDSQKHKQMKEDFHKKMNEMFGETYKENLGEDKVNELYEKYAAIGNDKSKNESNSGAMNEAEAENEEEMKDEKMHEAEDQMHEAEDQMHEAEDQMHEAEDEMDESHGVGLSQQKGVSGNQLPRPEYADYKKNKIRYALQKEGFEKKIKSLIEENKNLTKKFNKLNDLNEGYKNALMKSKKQLQEMAVINTNIAHANDILIKESLDQDRAKEIISKFQNVETITESEKIHKEIISETVNHDKVINENIERKINKTLGESSGNLIEKNGYTSNSHLDRIKSRMNYTLSK